MPPRKGRLLPTCVGELQRPVGAGVGRKGEVQEVLHGHKLVAIQLEERAQAGRRAARLAVAGHCGRGGAGQGAARGWGPAGARGRRATAEPLARCAVPCCAVPCPRRAVPCCESQNREEEGQKSGMKLLPPVARITRSVPTSCTGASTSSGSGRPRPTARKPITCSAHQAAPTRGAGAESRGLRAAGCREERHATPAEDCTIQPWQHNSTPPPPEQLSRRSAQ